MAEYRKGKRRGRSDDRFFTYLITAFVVIVVVILAGLGVYRLMNPTLNYSDFEAQTIQNYSEIDDRSESQYLVYFYGKNCGHCTEIKADVLEFAQENDAGLKVYLLESSTPTDVNNIVDPQTSAPMNGTPAMVTVVNGRIVDINSGKNLVLDVLESINEGSYGFIE